MPGARLFSLAAVAAVLAGCTVGPDFLRPDPPKVGAYTPTPVSLPAAGAGPEDASQRLAVGAAVAAQWWQLFRSKALDDTLAEAIASSPTLESARATLASARQAVAQVAGAYYPQLDATADASRTRPAAGSSGRSAPITNQFSIGPIVSFDPDPFGLNRRLVEQQAALAEVARYQLGAAYLALTGNAVTQAINIGSAREQLKAVEEIIAVDERNLELVRIAQEAGRSARTDVLSAQSQLASDRALLPALRQQLAAAQHALAVLAGRSPADWTPVEFDLDMLNLPAELPVSLPSALVRERPDILAAEAQLHASSAAIGVATAQLYPNLTLSASWSRQSQTVGGLFDGNATAWSLVGGLTAPIFHGGTLEAQRQGAIADFEAQFATWRQTVLAAFQQVADVLRALQHDAELLSAQRTATELAAASLTLTQESYAAGQASFLQVLEAQRLFQQSRLGYARARGQRYLDTAQLFAAMGGAWREWEEATTAVK
jgi:NodT family efflux transporter outer membrane factor (OMF) lipoprotein